MDVYATSADDEAFLLDLLNTTPVVDGVPTDALPNLAASAPWLTDRGIPVTDQEWAALIEARTSLQDVARGDASPAVLQRFLTGVQLTPTVGDSGVDWHLDGAGGAARAVLAWDGLRVHSPGRLRPCANSDCRLFLIDRSKPNSARWCSMAICGNRMKARRHYQRSRS
jgi:hypothetical protein